MVEVSTHFSKLTKPMLNPLITLTTDFGLTDHFVAAMKGVILGIAPKARLVDITHQVQAFEVPEAAFVIAEAQALQLEGQPNGAIARTRCTSPSPVARYVAPLFKPSLPTSVSRFN